jgi:hypothetical protein
LLDFAWTASEGVPAPYLRLVVPELDPLVAPRGLEKLCKADEVVARPLRRPEPEVDELPRAGEPDNTNEPLALCWLRRPSSSSESESSSSGTILESANRPTVAVVEKNRTT